MDCRNCGYCWADINEDGEPESLEYCHFDGPEGWAPCEQDSYDEYANEADLEAREAEEEYERWLAETEQAIYDEDYRSSVEYYGEPYDYQEF